MFSLGIDIGTSGIRAVVMDGQQHILAQAQSILPESIPYYSDKKLIIGYSQNPEDWWHTFESVIFKIAEELKTNTSTLISDVTHMAIDGTSGTVLFTDSSGTPCSDALMYNDQRATPQANSVKLIAPSDTAAIGATSGLAKLLWLYEHSQNQDVIYYALNQSDWISGKLMDRYGLSDQNNALKMGYDAQKQSWPDWLVTFLDSQKFPFTTLPEVFIPGQAMDTISTEMAHYFGFNEKLQVCAGTTDSTAAIIASGVKEVGEAITSLGSTLVMKVISDSPIFNPDYGVYSQPYGQLWLVGGSSNSGGAVLKSLFCPGEISEYTESLNSKIDSGQFSLLDLEYYPLLSPGERFPVQNSQHRPKMIPKPNNELDFFQALLEGMADIETLSYKRLLELGAPYPKRVTSIGGGAFNRSWRYIRELKLNVPVLLAQQEQAAAGTAILAQSTWMNKHNHR